MKLDFFTVKIFKSSNNTDFIIRYFNIQKKKLCLINIK